MPKQYTAPAPFADKPYSAIHMVSVESNQVKTIGYDTTTKTLAVSFTRGPGHIYHYPNVEPKVHADFMAAESKGNFFGKHIKPLAFEKFPAQTQEKQPVPISPATIAAALHGLEYPLRTPNDITERAKAAGICIVYGASDDLMEFDGAFRDEVGAYDGTTALIDANGILPSWENASEHEDSARDYFERKPKARSIEALWAPAEPDGASWAYKTDIPHVTFDVMEDGEIYCRGIVFALADLSAPKVERLPADDTEGGAT